MCGIFWLIHRRGISLSDARRLMDNCRFILRDVDSKAANQIKVIEGALESSTKDAPLLPWYAVATPHEDIREGRLDEAVFAANIWAVVEGKAPDVYVDAEEFFRKTFMTEGLGSRTQESRRRLFADGRDSGDRIISLQTAFGGGKTHTLVALWHLVQHAARLQKSPHAKNCAGHWAISCLKKLIMSPYSRITLAIQLRDANWRRCSYSHTLGRARGPTGWEETLRGSSAE